MINKVTLVGRLGQDPELKYLPNGTPVTSLSVATSEKWKDKSGNKQERTEWHKVVMFGRVAEVANQYLNKGEMCYLEGKIQTQSWEKDGVKRYTTKIVASTLKLLESKSENSKDTRSNDGDPGYTSAPSEYEISTDSSFAADNIPF